MGNSTRHLVDRQIDLKGKKVEILKNKIKKKILVSFALSFFFVCRKKKKSDLFFSTKGKLSHLIRVTLFSFFCESTRIGKTFLFSPLFFL